MKSNPYKIDDAEEFEPTLASQVKSLEIWKNHTQMILCLLRSWRWTGRFYYSEDPDDYTVSSANIDSHVCPCRYLPTLTTAFCCGLVWAVLKPRKMGRSSEMKRGDWLCVPQRRSGFPCFYSGAVLRCCCRRKSGQGISSRTGDLGQPEVLLVL